MYRAKVFFSVLTRVLVATCLPREYTTEVRTKRLGMMLNERWGRSLMRDPKLAPRETGREYYPFV